MTTCFFATTAGEYSTYARTIYHLITDLSGTNHRGRFLLRHAVVTEPKQLLSSLLGVASVATIFHFEDERKQLDQLLNQSHTVHLLSLPGFLAALPQPKIIILNGCTDQVLFNQFTSLIQGVVLGTPIGLTEQQSLTFARTFYQGFLFNNRTVSDAYYDAIAAAKIQPPYFASFNGYGKWHSEDFFKQKSSNIPTPRRTNDYSWIRSVASQGRQLWTDATMQWSERSNHLSQWLPLSTKPPYGQRGAQFVAIILTIIFSIWFYTRLTTGEEPPPTTTQIQLQPATDRLAPIREGQIIDGLAFGHDGNALYATGIEHTIYQWRLPTGELLPMIDVESSSVNHIGLDRAGTLLTYSGRDGAVGVISLAYSWRHKFDPHIGAVAALHVSHNGRALFTSSMDGTLMHHDLVSGESRLLRSDPQDPIFAVTTNATDELLAFATNNTIQIWRWATREPLYQFIGHQGPVNWVEFSPDGHTLLSAGSDHTVRLWEIATQTERHRFSEATNAINVVRYFPDGALFAGAGDDGQIRVWNAQSYQLVEAIEGFPGGIAALAINYNGSQLAAVGRNGALTIWNVVPQQEERQSPITQ